MRKRISTCLLVVLCLYLPRVPAAVGADTAAIPSAAQLGAVDLGAPCRIVVPHSPILATDKSDRRYLVLNSCMPGAAGAALLVDYERGQTQAIPFPRGAGGWGLREIAPGRLLFESIQPLSLIPVDLGRPAIDVTQIRAMPQQQLWHMEKGTDGWIYLGSYNGHAYRYHWDTQKLEDLGRIGPAGNDYVRYVGVTGDGWLICSVMAAHPGAVAYEIATGQQHWLKEAQGRAPHLCTVGGVVYARVAERLMYFDSKSRAFRETDWPLAPGVKYWREILPTSTPARKLLQAQDDTWYLIEKDQAPRQIWTLNLRGGELAAVDDRNRVIGFRGQDYFVAEPLAKFIAPKPLVENPPPVAIHFICADPKGGVTGGPKIGQTLFRFDPARHLQQNTSQVLDAPGEVCEGLWVDGKFYFASYSEGDLAVWDPDQPWDQWNRKNPRALAKYNGAKWGSLIRPRGMALGPGKRLYVGWSAGYGQVGGGLTEYDLSSGLSRSWTDQKLIPQTAITALTADEKFIYGITSNIFNGIKPPAKLVVFWVFDPALEKIVYRETLAGDLKLAEKMRPQLVRVPATGHIYMSEPAGLRRFNPATLSFAPTVRWPAEVSPVEVVLGYDTRGDSAWFSVGKQVVQLDDGPTPSARVWFRADTDVVHLAAGTDSKLYFTQGVKLWALPMRP